MGILEWRSLEKAARVRHIDTMKTTIMDKYGFEPSTEYCNDLITFLETLGPPEEAMDEP